MSFHKYKHYLQILKDKNLNLKLKLKILRKAPDEVICLITSVCLNLLKGKVVNIDERNLKKLKKYRKYLHTIADTSQSSNKKRKYLILHTKELESALSLAIQLIIDEFEKGKLIEDDGKN